MLNTKIEDFIKTKECKEYTSIEVASKGNLSICIIYFANTHKLTFTEYHYQKQFSSENVKVASWKDLCTISTE